MNVIKESYDNLPEYWKRYVSDHNWFDLSQFKHSVAIQFEDGSNAFFKHAFVVHDSDREELAVFTEHSGYYVLQTKALDWQILTR